ncbi:cytochrome bd-I ubiquinol oxidase subunit 2 apoprotein [Pseudomonas sp. NFIX10]|uniref:cytochrome d ubiquinol oxidase subunit II n=1 Tax=unclassified Pseudomonas TaxID=196821 RepID=UPI0008E95329|nr:MULTISPECIES: cytochrome d ubiquinol oxidase subunit II [unclassified Pseudomonas]SFB15395.1 cytochrome bd-I ubiquinol oxidase subunit 2 apoprotein [Pseudomonas sp. NFIX10]SFE72273.1 cytochrome bd-I ubiquinol oxidase subunit 2 apoprotein [Pseudomonas sp. NFACC06-1]
MADGDWIILLSAAALAFSVISYALLDGADLGVGMLMGVTRRARHRRAMAVSILPIWDANETWLVLGGGGLLALFPKAYAVLLPALYIPFIIMFMALIVRAMALEFRDEATRHGLKRIIDLLLGLGSWVAGMCQGAVLGTLVQGVSSRDGQFSGTGWEWSGPFPIFCGAVLVVGYLWLGACWLYWRTEDELQSKVRAQAKALSCLTIVLLMILVGWTSTLASQYATRLATPEILIPASVSMLTLTMLFFAGFRTQFHYLPLFCAIGVFVIGFVVMVATLYPLIVPPDVTLSNAASGPVSQRFMLIGFAVLIPMTLFYNTYGFRVFSGKIRPVKD